MQPLHHHYPMLDAFSLSVVSCIANSVPKIKQVSTIHVSVIRYRWRRLRSGYSGRVLWFLGLPTLPLSNHNITNGIGSYCLHPSVFCRTAVPPEPLSSYGGRTRTSHHPTGDATLLLPSHSYTGCFYLPVMWKYTLGLPNTPALCAASQLRGTKEVFIVMPATPGCILDA